MTEDFEAAGGYQALMKQLLPLLDGSALAVTSHTVAEAQVADAQVIHPLAQHVAEREAITLLRDSLCPDFGIVKTGIAPRKTRRFSGPAVCFDAADQAIAALQAGHIRPGQVVVMRGAGVCGGPGMAGAVLTREPP